MAALAIIDLSGMNVTTLATTVINTIFIYASTRIFYLLYFHPLSRFPGPELAAVSNLWYAYHWLSGRWPWTVEKALYRYGPVVRIAPNELAFFTPQAFRDIYAPQHRNLEDFVKTDFQDRGKDLGGLIWEQDPVHHRNVARQIAPAFSSRYLRSLEPIVHEHMDYFVAKMKQLNMDPKTIGVLLVRWTSWLAMDMAADLAWNEKVHQMRDMKDSVNLDVLLSFNSFATVIAVFKRFPLIRPLQYLFAPFGKITLFSQMEKATSESVLRRIGQRGHTEHPDYFDFILPVDAPYPANKKDLLHIGSVALQVMFAGWGPMGDLFYGALVILLENPESHQLLSKEVRESFSNYKDIAPGPTLTRCACSQATLLARHQSAQDLWWTGNTSLRAPTCKPACGPLARHPAYFHQPRRFQPQRWLPASHSLYDPAFANDHLKSLHPFSLSPRAKLFLAKVLWTFDVVQIEGQGFDLERGLLHYGFCEKPEMYVRFPPVPR
ncbi:hypothetical protein PG994_012639 [Apiospora phragmitis]|uniref:Cytochrome P450 n=1 Tax=Apiospora phragmitis TaxID=2905665 RepID=A0ABR1TB09_9PEZI